MAAGVAGDIMALGARVPDLRKTLGDIGFRTAKADIRTAGLLAGRAVKRAVLAGDQVDAGQEVSEARAGDRGQRAAALPLRDLPVAVKRDKDHLGRPGWSGRIGSGRRRGDAGRGAQTGKQETQRRHRHQRHIFDSISFDAWTIRQSLWHRCGRGQTPPAHGTDARGHRLGA
jgi:hypothetical protein